MKNLIDSDVQALIADCERDIDVLEAGIDYHEIYSSPSKVKEIRSELARQRLALAALTAEPYAYASRNIDMSKESQYFSASVFNNAWGDEYTVPLYTTQAQLLRPVKLPESQRLCNGYYFDMNDVFEALEEAGIPFKVKS